MIVLHFASKELLLLTPDFKSSIQIQNLSHISGDHAGTLPLHVRLLLQGVIVKSFNPLPANRKLLLWPGAYRQVCELSVGGTGQASIAKRKIAFLTEESTNHAYGRASRIRNNVGVRTRLTCRGGFRET